MSSHVSAYSLREQNTTLDQEVKEAIKLVYKKGYGQQVQHNLHITLKAIEDLRVVLSDENSWG